MFAEDDLRPISALQHLLFCERQCALIHVEQLWAENALTVTGRQLHEKADGGRGTKRRGRPAVTRSLPLRSLTLGVWGKADVVEFHDSPAAVAVATDGPPGGNTLVALSAGARVPFPVEYKRGKPKKNRCDEVQLCAQALCLEEMLGVAVPAGAIFYGVTRRRTDVAFDQPLRTLTRQTIDRLHAMLSAGVTPRAKREKKCDRCSLLHLCLPEALDGREPASRYVRRSLERAAMSDTTDAD
jgi:CRISPR-associated exonuclease Cas4